MTEHQLVDAYLRGQVDRRTFIRRLVTLGVSVAGATAYSNVLLASRATASHGLTVCSDYYDGTPREQKTATLSDSGFSPTLLKIGRNGMVAWTLSSSNTKRHDVVESMGLFSKRPLPKGATFSHEFFAAGKFTVTCTQHTPVKTQTVVVPLPVTVDQVSGSKLITVRWACNTAPSGFLFDAEWRRPGQARYKPWAQATHHSFGNVWDPAPGTHSFRARLRKTSTGLVSGWATKSVTI